MSKLWVVGVFRKSALTAFAAIFAAFFLTLVFPSADAYAADATWEGGSVVYNGDTYQGPRQAADGSPPGIPNGATYYEYLNDGEARVVYFEGDPTNADSARTATYRVSDGNYVQTGRASTITIDKQVDVEADTSEGDENITACVVNGIGYILCPIIQFLAEATDTVYGYLENFLQVEPLIANQDSTLYRAWAIARNVANLAFIVVFMVVIYSQLTSTGLNNYDIKRTIPRMLVAAVAVNLSYFIAAFLVDLSNIVGSSLNQLFISIVNEVGQGAERNVLASASFAEIATYVLSGGTIIAAGLFQGAVALSGMGMGVLFLFVFILVPIATIVLVTVAVLAARLALITVLIVLAPLAFVAYVLPGTKQWYDKWQDLFATMLLMYPMFAVLFGGSHLASYLIAQNADRWETVLIALFVQAVPLVITPFLIRFSGRLLGNFAGMVNNPAKGLSDRSKNFARDRMAENRERRIATGAPGSGLGAWSDDRRRNREGRRKRYEERSALRFARSAAGKQLTLDMMADSDEKGIQDNLTSAEYEANKLRRSPEGGYTNPADHRRAIRAKEADLRVAINRARSETFLEELQSSEGREVYAASLEAGGSKLDKDVDLAAAKELGGLAHRKIAMDSARTNADNAKRVEYAKLVSDRENGHALRQAAAGVAGAKGEFMAQGRAIKDVRADFGAGTSVFAEMMRHYNLEGGDVQKLAMGKESVAVYDPVTGQEVMKFDHNDEYVRDAAIEMVMQGKGTYDMMLEIIQKSAQPEFASHRGTIVGNLSKFMDKAKLGGSFYDKVGSGKVPNMDVYLEEVSKAVLDGKFSSEKLVKMDAPALEHWADSLGKLNALNPKHAAQLEAIKKSAASALVDEQLESLINDNSREYLNRIVKFDPTKMPVR